MTWLEKDCESGASRLRPSVEMAIRKIVWRALLQSGLDSAHETEPGNLAAVVEKPGVHSADVPVKWWTLSSRDSKSVCAAMRPPATDNGTSISAHPPSFDRLIKVKETSVPNQKRHQGEGVTDAGKRLGKLPQSAYMQGWEHFLNVAGDKLGVCWAREDMESLRNPVLEKRVEVLHTLRCFLGSTVETAILLDRLQWIREELAQSGNGGEDHSQTSQHSWKVELVNLFDQEIGSGRNIAVVISPVIPPYTQTGYPDVGRGACPPILPNTASQ